MENNQAVAVLSSEKERNGKLIKNLQVNQKSIATLRQGATLLGKGFAVSTIAGMALMNPILSIGSFSALTLSYGAYRYYQKDLDLVQEELRLRRKWNLCLAQKMTEIGKTEQTKISEISVEERIEYLFNLYTSTVVEGDLSVEDTTSITETIDKTGLSTKVKDHLKQLVYRCHKVPKSSY